MSQSMATSILGDDVPRDVSRHSDCMASSVLNNSNQSEFKFNIEGPQTSPHTANDCHARFP